MRETTKRVKLFTIEGHQAVRLPAEFRFDGDEIYIRRDAATGDVIFSSRPQSDWRAFMTLRDQSGSVVTDFLGEREQKKDNRDPFDSR